MMGVVHRQPGAAPQGVSPEALLDTVETLLAKRLVAFVATDDHAQIIHASKGVEKVLDVSGDEVLGKAVGSLFPEAGAPEAPVAENHRDIKSPHRDGTAVDVEVWSAPLPLQDGNTGRLFLADDVTEHKFLERALIEASEQERRKIGQDLHDHLCQHLLGAAFAAKALAGDLEKEGSAHATRLHDLARLINEAVSQVRDVSRGLHPVELDSAGLMSALHELASRTNPSVSCEFECDPPVLLDDAEQALHAYRIAQEAVAAAFHQTTASQIRIRLSEQGDWITLLICDNGQTEGDLTLDPKGTVPKTLQYRALAMNGRLSLSFDPQKGTCVKCDFPRRQ